jgi:hypothetical protein
MIKIFNKISYWDIHSNSTKYGGHFGVIADYDQKTKMVVVGDPEPPNFKEATLLQILLAISDKQDGVQRGFFVVGNDI